MSQSQSRNQIVFLRHTETGVQVGRDRVFASRIIQQDPNANIILHSATPNEARAAVHVAIETLRFTNQLETGFDGV